MLKTKRCYLKLIEHSDREHVIELYLDQNVRKYLGGVQSYDAINGVLRAMLAPKSHSYYWGVFKKETDEFLGLVSITPHHEQIDQEITYQFLPKWWGNGYASEAVQHVVNYALGTLKFPRIIAETQVANCASRRLLERVGLKYEEALTRFGVEQVVYSVDGAYLLSGDYDTTYGSGV